MQPTYSFIVPAFNEGAKLPELYGRPSGVMDGIDGTVELVLVDDGSHDRSLAMMRELHEHDRRCYLLLGSRAAL